VNIIPGFPGYFATEDGRIWSAKRGGRFRKPSLAGRYALLGLCVDGVQHSCAVHVLVASAFLGPRPAGMEVRHLDGNEFNNNVRNLRYGTHSENMHDKRTHGTNPQVNKTHCKYGHEYTPENIYIWAGMPNRRNCRACRRGPNRKA
jgi:hypothetical protein